MTQPKKLIEVAMPIKEISAESVRDKSIRHGHISTLHLWWARRPLPVCRAVVFASLVPDPLDAHCPPAFRQAVELLLGKEHNPGDPYQPYADIPWTAVYDPMDDNPRNRLQLFIGKFTDAMQQALLHNKPVPGAKDQLSGFSLIKWENKNNEQIINKARQLIWVAHNAAKPPISGSLPADAATLMAGFDAHHQAIKTAEHALYGLPDRHLATQAVQEKEAALHLAIEAFLDRMPRVFDPFAGGGAIPLEAARLGCRTFGNDINPVAHIIQKGSLEFPQKYGKPIAYSHAEFVKLYGQAEYQKHHAQSPLSFGPGLTPHSGAGGPGLPGVSLPNRLAFDVQFYARKLLAEAEKEIGHLYPPDENGRKPIAYYWARVGTCSNPSCRAEVPLLKGFYLADTKTKQVYLQPIIAGNKISFEIKKGKCEVEGWNTRGNLKCPCCGSVTDVNKIKQQNINGYLIEQLLAVIIDGQQGKEYRLPTEEEINVVAKIPAVERPTEKMQRNSAGGDTFSWGISRWGDMFSPRQLLALQTLVAKLNALKAELKPRESEYDRAVVTYLGILLDRIAVANTSFGIWHTGGEKLERIMGRQAIPMVFDYPESNPFCHSSGSAANQLEWITRYIESESGYPFSTSLQNASSGEKEQFPEKHLTAVVTDPPYYDAIAYADLSDFFYVWMKRTLADVYPHNFATPQTPKTEECTALKHHHNGQAGQAKAHFENKLRQIFDAIEHQTTDVVSIMFAHQSTEAWTTLCNSILGARMNITGSWATDTEMTGALKTDKAFLSSSVTVACRPLQGQGSGSYQTVKRAVEHTVARQVETLYKLGFRGADLLTACFGQAVSEFGRYEKVEKADGSPVSVADLLAMAKESAFNALLKGFDGDDFTKFYIGWLQLYGFAESDFNDAVNLVRVGLSIDVAQLFDEHILIRNGNRQTLGGFGQRTAANARLGQNPAGLLIDHVHRAMALYQGTDRRALLLHLAAVGQSTESPFWRVVTSLCEVLPGGSDDHRQAAGLLANKDSLLRETKAGPPATAGQATIFD